MESKDDLIETAELASLIEKKTPNLRLIDMPTAPTGKPEPGFDIYKEGHIPGTNYFDFTKTSDKSCNGKVCSEEAFIEYAKTLKIRKTDIIVCYDHKGVMFACRPWLVFRLFGAENVKVLNGGFPKWKAEGRAIEKGDAVTEAGPRDPDKPDSYSYKLNSDMIVDMDYINSIVPKLLDDKRDIYLIDSRPANKYSGAEPETKPGLRAGHVTGSVNMPPPSFFNPDGLTFKSIDELKNAFKLKAVEIDKKIITMCMAGVLACIPLFCLWRLGNKKVSLYNGNWVEYGMKPEPEWEFE